MDSHNHKASGGDEHEVISGDYFVVKAKEQGVTVIGLTRERYSISPHGEIRQG